MAFQFRESFLVTLARAAHTARFGNFLHDSPYERAGAELERFTPSVWTALMSESVHLNELYVAVLLHSFTLQ